MGDYLETDDKCPTSFLMSNKYWLITPTIATQLRLDCNCNLTREKKDIQNLEIKFQTSVHIVP